MSQEWGFGDNEEIDSQSEQREDLQQNLTAGLNTFMDLEDQNNQALTQILSDIETEDTVAGKMHKLEIGETNKEVSKNSNYIKNNKTKEDQFSDDVLNHSSDDLVESVSAFSVSPERKKKYDLYEQMLDNNYIAYRILKVKCDNILIKNAQSKDFLMVGVQEDKEKILTHIGKDVKNAYIKFGELFTGLYRLQTKLKEEIVPRSLLYGNYFQEIIDLNKLDNIGNHTQLLLETTMKDSAEWDKIQDEERTKALEDLGLTFESTFDLYQEHEVPGLVAQKQNNLKILEESYNTSLVQYKNSLDSRNKKTTDALRLIQEGTDLSNEENQKIIQEAKEIEVPQNPKGFAFLEGLIQENTFSSSEIGFLSDYGLNAKPEEKKFKVSDISTLDFTKLENIYLKNLHPKNVVIIENNGLTYGYLVIEEDLAKGKGEYVIDSFKRFSSGLTNSAVTGTSDQQDQQTVNAMTTAITDELLKKVVYNVNWNKSKIGGYGGLTDKNSNLFTDLDISDEAKSSLRLIIYNKLREKSKLKFRFLSPETVVNFGVNVDKYAPYGTSEFDSLVGPVKLYTLALMSSIVSRLSRASVVRKWTIETGAKRNQKELVEKTKQELKSKSINFNKINNLKNISEIVTDFRDLASISVNGQRFIDMEILPMGDQSLPLNDLQDLRNDIISAGGVPAVYLNIGDGADLRESVVHLNISFANDMSSKQSSYENGIDDIMNFIFRLILKYNGYVPGDFYLSKYLSIRLNPPLVLQIQSDEAMITTVTNIVSLLDQIGVQTDPVETFKRYIPGINWDKMIEEGKIYQQKLGKKAITSVEDPNAY